MAAMAMILALCALAVGLQGASGATFNVGDNVGWSVPQSGYNYSNWASSNTFHKGDMLFFRYNATRHTVCEVTAANYDSCTITAPLTNDNGAGNTIVTLNNEGDTYIICSVGTHCLLGMKFKVTVMRSRAPVLPSPGLAMAAAVLGLIAFLV